MILARVVTSYEIKKYFYARTIMRKCTKDPRTCERETYVSAGGDLLRVPSLPQLGYPVAPAADEPVGKPAARPSAPFATLLPLRGSTWTITRQSFNYRTSSCHERAVVGLTRVIHV